MGAILTNRWKAGTHDGKHDNPILQKSLDVELGTTYRFKVTMEGTYVTVWFYDKADEQPEEPTFEYDVADNAIRTHGSFHFTSWAGDYTIDNLEICNTAKVPVDTVD